MTLNHSKTWPVSTLSVVQLRVDPQNRTYSTLHQELCDGPLLEQIADSEEPITENWKTRKDLSTINNRFLHKTKDNVIDGTSIGENGVVVPLLKNHLDFFTKMTPHPFKTTVRTDTVSTILDQDVEFFDSDKHQEFSVNNNQPPEPAIDLEKFHVLALTRIDETLNETDTQVHHAIGRRPSIKVDNWDFIYTENPPISKPSRCPVHRCANEPIYNGDVSKVSLLPDLPLDARKTTTLRRHYYLEGGWGWVIVVCGVLVCVLNHGVQLSCSQLITPGAKKFKVEAVHFAGK